MARFKMHAKRELSYDPQTSGIVWTQCGRHVDYSQIAAFVPDGVSCKQCRANLEWNAERAREQAAYRAARASKEVA